MRKIEKQISDYFEYCEIIRQMSPTTISFKRYVISDFFSEMEVRHLKDINNQLLNDWVASKLQSGVSARSINTYVAIIISMVRYFNESGALIPLNIRLVKSLKENQPRRCFYSKREIERVLRCADLVSCLMIRIMFETGMRIAELTRLKRSDFDGRKVMFVGKGRKEREAYISLETLRILDNYVVKYDINEYLWGFEAINGEPPTINTVRNRLRRVFEKAGFDGFYPHAIRHSFATDLQLKGASVVEIKEMMGHESIATTERYLHGFDGRLEELFEKYR